MEVLRAVLESGSVTGAARLLNISQPAVTGMLRHTEDQLRLRLFERVKGRLEPTPEARALYAEIALVFERVDRVNRVVEGLREARLGTLNVVCIPVVGTALLPSAIGAFVAARKGASLRFQVQGRREVIELVASGAADLGFGFLLPEHPRIAAREIARGDLVCILPKGHPLGAKEAVAAADLPDWPLITYTSSQGLAPIINGIIAEARVAQRAPIEVGLIVNAWAMVNQGAGIAIVDPHSGLGQLFPDVVVRPFVPGIPVGLEVVHAEDRPLSGLALGLIGLLERLLRGAAGPPDRPAARQDRRS
jgi:DNA-binding transcriptional LysR family regulator